MTSQRIFWIQTDLLLDMVICFNGAAADHLTLAMLSNTQPPHKHAGLLDGHLRVSELCSSSQCSSLVENISLFIFLLSALLSSSFMAGDSDSRWLSPIYISFPAFLLPEIHHASPYLFFSSLVGLRDGSKELLLQWVWEGKYY